MKPIRTLCAAVMIVLFATTTTYASGLDEFDSDKMMSDLESKLELSSDKRDKLKPALDTKSEELKKHIHASVDEGFRQLGELSTQLDTHHEDLRENIRTALNFN